MTTVVKNDTHIQDSSQVLAPNVDYNPAIREGEDVALATAEIFQPGQT